MISGESMRAMNELRDGLNKVNDLTNKLLDDGFVVQFEFQYDPKAKKQSITKFEVYSKIDLSKTSS